MAHYRLYFFEEGGDGLHIRARAEFECANDNAAIREAEKRADGRRMELWRGASLVKGWPPTPRS
jgi:hypothetical protein